MIDDREQALVDLKEGLVTNDTKSLDGVEDYLKGVVEADCLESADASVLLADLQAFREKYHVSEQVQEAAKASITFYVAECMEHPTYGEYHETADLKEAFEILDTIPPQRLNAVTGIGFILHDENSAVNDCKYPLMQIGQVQTAAINHISEFKESPLVQGAIKECEQILKDREKVMESVVEKPHGDKTSDRIKPPTKKSILKSLKENQAVVDKVKAEPATAKAKEAVR
jgi:hypothetical protein